MCLSLSLCHGVVQIHSFLHGYAALAADLPLWQFFGEGMGDMGGGGVTASGEAVSSHGQGVERKLENCISTEKLQIYCKTRKTANLLYYNIKKTETQTPFSEHLIPTVQ